MCKEKVEIKFVKVHPDAQLPKQNHSGEGIGDTGFDLYSVEDTAILPGESKIVPVGVKVGYITPGYWFKIEARSGLGFKHGIEPHCVPKGTLISTPNGDVKVEELFESSEEKSRYVLSYNEEKNIIEVDVITDMWIVNSELLEIETEEGSKIQIPPTKEVYTKRGWVAAIDLTNKDEILSIN